MLNTVHILLAVLLVGLVGNISLHYTMMCSTKGDDSDALARSLRANLTSALEESERRLTSALEESERRDRRARELASELDRSYSNYLIHIPKAGGYSAFEYLALDRAELSAVPLSPKQAKVCNHGGAQINKWGTWDWCWLHTTESFYSTEPGRSFVILRDPVHHTMSMWNYCTQSPKRKSKWSSMPDNLEEWLTTWADVQAKKIGCPHLKHGGATERGCPSYRCYNALDLQSHRTKMMGRNPRDLEVLYDVVGLTDQMAASTCLISIAIHGKVPKRCDCSGKENRATEIRVSHGVTTHGHDANLTETQLRMIHAITSNDVPLVEAAGEIFREQVSRAEKEYDFKMCM
ncbi:hypothetical protein ACHAXT_009812 [Thalassiosira profunda]